MYLAWTVYVLILILILFFWFLIKTYNYWQKQNVPCLGNPIPGFGHIWPIISLKCNFTKFSSDVYKKYNSSAIGFYFMRSPALILRDPELVKNVMVTNFSCFRKNRIELNEKSDPILSKNPFFIADPLRWKASRSRAISHVSSKNLKFLFDIVKNVGEKMISYVDRKIKKNDGSLECELKIFCTKYTSEIVANSAFGIEGQSFDENPNDLAFVNVSKKLFEPTLLNGIKQAIVFFLPDLAKIINLNFLGKTLTEYYREIVKEMIKQRKKVVDQKPNDFLQFCINNNSEDLDSIVADILIYYVDVYETSSSSLSILLYYLSQNQIVQKKLRNHVISKLKENNNKVTYESLKSMNYLEQVINESLRVMTPLGALLKVCTDEITLTGSDGLKYQIQPGTTIIIPSAALHNDKNYWKNPETFDPDRFENSEKPMEGTFLPFGDGPRMCLGMRFGLLVVKLATVMLIKKYSINHSPKTKTPFEMEATSIITYVKGGLWAKFEPL